MSYAMRRIVIKIYMQYYILHSFFYFKIKSYIRKIDCSYFYLLKLITGSKNIRLSEKIASATQSRHGKWRLWFLVCHSKLIIIDLIIVQLINIMLSFWNWKIIKKTYGKNLLFKSFRRNKSVKWYWDIA